MAFVPFSEGLAARSWKILRSSLLRWKGLSSSWKNFEICYLGHLGFGKLKEGGQWKLSAQPMKVDKWFLSVPSLSATGIWLPKTQP